MIDDILKEHKPGDKPRFFLHDEMKEWLKDHLTLTVTDGESRSSDYNLQQKLNLNDRLPIGFDLSFTLSLDREFIAFRKVHLSMQEYERAFQCVANVNEKCMIEINRLISEVQVLQQRIHELEKK